MNCRKVQNLLSAYLDREMSGVEMFAIRRHLSECAGCNLEFESLIVIKQALGNLPQKNPSRGLADHICQRLDHAPLPKQEQILAAFRKHLTIFPARLRLASIGVSAFAILLMLRTGEMIPNIYTSIPISPSVSIAQLADKESVSLFPTTTTVEAASFNPAPSGYKSTLENFMLPDEIKRPSQPLVNANFVLTSY